VLLNISYILKVKDVEEYILKTFEFNKKLTTVESDLLNLLLKIKWIDKKFFKMLD